MSADHSCAVYLNMFLCLVPNCLLSTEILSHHFYCWKFFISDIKHHEPRVVGRIIYVEGMNPIVVQLSCVASIFVSCIHFVYLSFVVPLDKLRSLREGSSYYLFQAANFPWPLRVFPMECSLLWNLLLW